MSITSKFLFKVLRVVYNYYCFIIISFKIYLIKEVVKSVTSPSPHAERELICLPHFVHKVVAATALKTSLLPKCTPEVNGHCFSC